MCIRDSINAEYGDPATAIMSAAEENGSEMGGSQFGDGTGNNIKRPLHIVREELEEAKIAYREFKHKTEDDLVGARRLLLELQRQCEAEDDEEEKPAWQAKVDEQEQKVTELEEPLVTRKEELAALEAAYDARAEEEEEATEELRKIQKKIADLEAKKSEWEKSHPNGGEAVPQEILDKLKKNEQRMLVLSGELAREKGQEKALEQHQKEVADKEVKEELSKLAEQLARQNEDNLLTMAVLKRYKGETEDKIRDLKAAKKEQADLVEERKTSINEMEKLSLPQEELEEVSSKLSSEAKDAEEALEKVNADLAKQKHQLKLTDMLIEYKKEQLKTASEELAEIEDGIEQTKAMIAVAKDDKTKASYEEALQKLEDRRAEILHKQNLPDERAACCAGGDCSIM
eukprot:TRINITY_DN412_c0_g2_i5.p1 TRINITY_DN412_c0_g2~~TRINITY_DN412_c0_g2_i5.p1  ORF type:complete len:414 (-),score=212.00 TRINITY_DN412_c0_g2_i5:426-1628(-)